MPPSQNETTSTADDARDRLERAIAAASTRGEYESPAVCDAVEEVVAEARDAGHPPERVLVLLKTVAYGVLDGLRLPLNGARAAIAWIVRCAVKAYYRRA